MNIHTILVGIIALLVGVGAGYALAPEKTSVGSHTMPHGSVMENTMGDMMAALEGKRGDEFDKAFLNEMIIHHEGAVTMAEAALQHAHHAEIKTMATAIIDAQKGEIDQMNMWLKEWYAR